MKIKPLYIYLILFVAFIVGIIIFSNYGSTSGSQTEISQQLPDDDIHRGMGGDGEMPSGSNVTSDARQRLEEYKSKYEKNPNDTLNAREFADLLKMAHQQEKAIEIYERILEKDSKRIDILLELTFLYFNLGNLDKAENYTNNILKIDKDHQLGNYNSGAIAASKGDKAKARSIWQGLVKKYPNSEIGQIAEQSIIQLEKTNQK
jgi:tetratricopeptide (TPR) repeat protein